MPIYEYRRADGSTFDVVQKFSDEPLTKDPETGEPVERVYSAPAIHFKGSGFHNTDYSSSRRAKAGQSGSEGSSTESAKSNDSKGGDKPSEKKSESKSTKSSDTKTAKDKSK